MKWCNCTYGCDAEHVPDPILCKANPRNGYGTPELVQRLYQRCRDFQDDLAGEAAREIERLSK